MPRKGWPGLFCFASSEGGEAGASRCRFGGLSSDVFDEELLESSSPEDEEEELPETADEDEDLWPAWRAGEKIEGAELPCGAAEEELPPS